MTIFNIIMFACCYPIMLLVLFIMWKAVDKNNYCFGATLKKEYRSTPEILAIDADYRRKMKRSAIVLAIVPFSSFFFSYMSVVFGIWMIWILVICFLPMVYFAQANKQVLELKNRMGWQENREMTYTDLKVITDCGRIKWTEFLPMLIAGTLPMIPAFLVLNEKISAYFWIVFIFALITWFIFAVALWTDHRKIVVLCEDSQINMNYCRAKKQAWKELWMQFGWVNVIMTWATVFFLWKREYLAMGILWGGMVYSLVLLLFAGLTVKKILKINYKYQKYQTVYDKSDDDRYWIYGLMYYNRKDKSTMVENRMGTGMSMNLAKPVSMWLYGISGAVLLIIPVMLVWMAMMDFTPIQTVVKEDVIVCRHLKVDYEIPLSQITSYKVITELPDMMKVAGTGMDTVYKGTFEVYREGMYETFLNPQNSLFLVLTTAEEIYYISGGDDAQTKAILEALGGQ